ncbi:MAG: ring-opening amidohydrolase [Candidatus Bathyarchaeia archaeon]
MGIPTAIPIAFISMSPAMQRRIVNVFAKGGAHPTGRVRDRRTTLLTDSDISSTRHMRAVVSAAIASIVGDQWPMYPADRTSRAAGRWADRRHNRGIGNPSEGS